MKNLLTQLGAGLLIGAFVGALSGVMYNLGALQYWNKLDYVPYPVEELVFISGDSVWVETELGGGTKLTLTVATTSVGKR